MFLDSLFGQVLLGDRTALTAAGPGRRVSLLRRVLLATGILTGLVLAIGFLVSYLSNSALERDVRTAAAGCVLPSR